MPATSTANCGALHFTPIFCAKTVEMFPVTVLRVVKVARGAVMLLAAKTTVEMLEALMVEAMMLDTPAMDTKALEAKILDAVRLEVRILDARTEEV